MKGLLIETQDIDIVVSEAPDEHFDPEWIKDMIRRADYRYFLEPSRQPGATYHILYCRLPGWATDPGRRVKLDILVPPTLGLPKITVSEAIPINGIPVMPVFDLLIMRTQGWWEHRISSRSDFRKKVNNDVSEIFALLQCAMEEGVSYVNEANKRRHSPEFMGRARTFVNSFVNIHGGYQQWRALQFPVANADTRGAVLVVEALSSYILTDNVE